MEILEIRRISKNVGIQGSVDSVFVYNTALTINELSYLQKFAQEIIPTTASTGGYAVSTKEPFYLKTMPITTQSLARSSTQTIDGLSQLTISMWVKVNGLSNGQIMGLVEKSNGKSASNNLGKEYSVELYYESDKGTADIRLNLGSSDGNDWAYTWNSYATIPHDGTWNHFSVVWDNNPNNAVQPSPYVAVIVNGIKTQFNFTGSNKLFKNTNNNAALFFGLSYPTYENKARYFNGAMDEIQIWHIARPFGQLVGVRAYRRVLSGLENGLVGYCPIQQKNDSMSRHVEW